MESRKKEDKKYMNAPFNFVKINDRVMAAYETEEQLPQSNLISDQYLSGEIYYRITVKSPVIIGKDGIGQVYPSKSVDEIFDSGRGPFIPSSSIKGLIRSNLQILSYSSVSNDILNRRFRYRSISSSQLGRTYASVIGKKKVVDTERRFQHIEYENICGGIIEHADNGIYYIRKPLFEPFKKMGGYYSIDIRKIQKIKGWQSLFCVYGNYGRNVFDCLGRDSYFSQKRWSGKQISTPFYTHVTFDMDNNGELSSVLDTGNPYKGYLLSSGYIPNNYRFYLIPDTKENESRFILPDYLIEDYMRETKDFPDRSGNFYQLPFFEEKPVFFLKNGSDLQFGFTPMFPVFYNNRVHSGIPREQFSKIIDYDKAMFGFANQKGRNYGGRLSFSDAVLKSGETVSVKIPLPFSPKPQYTPGYLENGSNVDYNHEHFRLNGIKQYWFRENMTESDLKNSKTGRWYHGGTAINTDSELEGCVRFFNLREDELGLLLWSISLNSDSEQNIGSGKPWGYGRIKIIVSRLNLWNNAEMYHSFTDWFSPCCSPADQRYFIEQYQKRLERFLDEPLEHNERLQDFFLMKCEWAIPVKNKTGYADLMEFRKRIPLVSVRNVAATYNWVVIPERYVLNEINQSEEKYAENFPVEIEDLYPEAEIIKCYEELFIKADSFRTEKNFLIKKEILDDLLEMLEEYQKKNYRMQLENDPYLLHAKSLVREEILNCLDEIDQYVGQYFKMRTCFLEDSVPNPSVHVSACTYEQTEEWWQVEIETQIIISNSKRLQPAFIEKVAIYEGGNMVWGSSEGCYVYSKKGKKYTAFLLYQKQELQNGSCVREVMLEYSFRLDGEKQVVTMWEKVTIPLLNQKEYQEFRNPYSAYARGAEVADRNMFFGRKEEIADVVSMVDNYKENGGSGQSIVLFGQKRAGKSTLLHYIKEKLRAENTDLLVIHVGNLGSSEPSDAGIQYFLLGSLKKELRRFYPEQNRELNKKGLDIGAVQEKLLESKQPTAVFTEFFKLFTEILDEKKYRLLFLIDEFTYIYGWILEGKVSRNFMIFWKAFIQNSRICAVLVGQDFMPDFINDYRNEFGAFKPRRVSYLEREDAAKLISEPFIKKNGREGFTRDAVELILNLTAGSAYYIMILCDKLVNYLNRRKKENMITAELINRFLDEVWLNENSNERLDKEIFDPLVSDGLYDRWSQENETLLQEIALCSYESGWCRIGDLRPLVEGFIQDWEVMLERLDSRDVLLVRQNREVKIKVQLYDKWLRFKYGEKKK